MLSNKVKITMSKHRTNKIYKVRLCEKIKVKGLVGNNKLVRGLR